MDACRLRSRLDLALRGTRPAVGDVVGHRVVEQHRVLRHDADRAAQAVLRERADVVPGDGDAPGAHVVEAEHQPRQRALAGARRTDHRHRVACRDLEAEIVQDRPRGLVGKAHVLEAHHRRCVGMQRDRIRRVLNLALALEQAEHLLQIGQRLLDLAVDHAQEVERNVELDHERVDHHQIAQRHAPRDHALGGAPQHGDQGDGDQQLLAGVEHRQRGLRLELGAAQLVQALVVAPGLEGFVVEVLDRLVVQQRVDRLGMRAGVQIVHLLAELGAPLGHRHGEDDVDHQRGQRDPGEGRVELDRQDTQHQAHLDQGGQDAVERVRNERLHTARAALDVARHAAGLALQVEAQAQRVQMLEDLQGDAARCALGGLGEDQLTQLGE